MKIIQIARLTPSLSVSSDSDKGFYVEAQQTVIATSRESLS